MLNLLVGPIVDLAETHFENKANEKKAVHERKLKSISQEADWENIQAQNAGKSWADEWFTLLLSLPLILAFFPGTRPFVEDGFMCIKAMPDFYKAWLSASIAAAFGLRGLSKWKK